MTDRPMIRRGKGGAAALLIAGLAILAPASALSRAYFRSFIIPSEAMAPTLVKGDYLMVREIDGAPARGDVVVFRLPRDGQTPYIKRIVGMPGERVQIKNGRVYVNGKGWRMKALPDGTEDMGGWERPTHRWEETNPEGRTYVTYDYGPDGDLDNTAVYDVPPGCYFVMGDNRDNSLDSRVPMDQGVGFVPAENMIGRVIWIFGHGTFHRPA